MQTKILALCIAAALTTVTTRSMAAPQMTAATLHHWCTSKADVWQANCVAYIMGVINGIEAADALDHADPAKGVNQPDPPRTIVCPPSEATTDQLVDLVTAMVKMDLEAYPEDKNLPAQSLVLSAVAHKYPCAKNKLLER